MKDLSFLMRGLHTLSVLLEAFREHVVGARQEPNVLVLCCLMIVPMQKKQDHSPDRQVKHLLEYF